MVSYASVVIAFLLLAGPIIILNAISPGTVDHWNVAMILSAGLFLIWLSASAHSAFTQYRFVESLEETHDISFVTEHAIAEATEPRPVTAIRKPNEMASPHAAPATAARGATVS